MYQVGNRAHVLAWLGLAWRGAFLNRATAVVDGSWNGTYVFGWGQTTWNSCGFISQYIRVLFF